MAKTGVRVGNHARLHRVQAAQLPTPRSRSGTRPTASSSRSTAAGAVAHAPPGDALVARADAGTAARARARRRQSAPPRRPAGARADGAGDRARRPAEEPDRLAAASRAASAFSRRVVGRAEESRVARPVAGDPSYGCRADRLHRGRRLPLFERSDLEARRPEAHRTSNGRDDVPLVRHQHLLRAREQGEGQSRAPDHLDEPGAAVPPRRRPDRAGDRDEGRPEGADRQARAARLRAREHGSERRRVGRGQEHARA